ncbi:MAG: LCP family protein [Actinoplanes sp.]
MSSSVNRRALLTRAGVALGSLLLVLAGGTLAAAGTKADLNGPLNILLAGIDPRGSHTRPLADAIIVAHIPADRRGMYLFSIPRDLVVQIPEFAPSGTPAQRGKINAAMGLGSQTSTGDYRPRQGYRLLKRAVGEVTGIRSFDGGAIINFGGFEKMVDAMGGVDMVIDQDVPSEHRKPDGSPRDRLPECQGHHNCLRPYTGVQMVYPKSDQPMRLSGWQALDLVRQRYGLPRSDYDRQRHQRQFLTAVAKQVSKGDLLKVAGQVGDSLTLVRGGHSLADWMAELNDLDTAGMTTVALPGEALFEDGKYLGEQYTSADVSAFFRAVVEDRVANFLTDHPGFVDVA